MSQQTRTARRQPLANVAVMVAGFIAAAAFVPAAYGAGPQPEPPTLPPVFKVDARLVPAESVPDARDGTARRLAAVVDDLGNRGVFIEDELIVVTDDPKALNGVVDRWHGEVIDTIDPARNDIAGMSPQYLVRVDPSGADTAELPEMLARLNPTRDIEHRVSSDRAIQLLTVAATEATKGLTVGINWLASGADIPRGTTQESDTGPVGFNTGPAYWGNAFDWFYLRDGGTLDIGVTQAWSVLAQTGRLDERVSIAVLDGGFAPDTNGDFPAGWRALSALPFTAATGSPNPSSCSGGTACPWHGTAVANAAAGAVDNRAGAAGPAGPVAQMVLVHESADMFNGSVALGLAYGAGARIANMSWSGEVPATLSFTALPFDLVTREYRNLGMLLFAAAGNDHINVDDTDCFILRDLCWEETWVFPCENGGVICIGGIDTSASTRSSGDPRSRAPGSSYGAADVDLFAPYTVLVGPDPTTGPGARAENGTSFASPFAAGVAALVWAAQPTLSADAVESILISTAHTSPDLQVRRYVDAGAAVAEAATRTIRIVAPTDGQVVSLGRSIELNADVYEDGHGPAVVRWTSGSRELGSPELRTSSSDFGVGSQSIVVTASWADGTSVSDRVTINVRNDPPTVEILNPTTGTFIEQSQLVRWSARTFDPNLGGRLPDTAVTWHLDGAATPFARGHTPPLTALPPTTLGEHIVTARATDGAATRRYPITINVVADDGIPDPTGRILNPSDGALLFTNWIGADGRPVHRLVLRTDAPGPASPPVTLVWFDSVDSGTAIEIGRGTSSTVDLLGLGCGTSHRLSLIAVDSAGHRYPPLDTVQVTVAPAAMC